MASVRGELKLTVNGKVYTLWLGMSVLADLQAKHGQDVLSRLDPPADAGEGWMPDLNIVSDLFAGALERHHAGEVDRWLVDDLLAQNEQAFQKLMGHGMPDEEKAPSRGNGKGPRRTA